MSNLTKRLEDLEKAYREALASNYLAAVIIRSDEDLEQHKGLIGPETKVIRIVAATKRVSI